MKEVEAIAREIADSFVDYDILNAEEKQEYILSAMEIIARRKLR